MSFIKQFPIPIIIVDRNSSSTEVLRSTSQQKFFLCFWEFTSVAQDLDVCLFVDIMGGKKTTLPDFHQTGFTTKDTSAQEKYFNMITCVRGTSLDRLSVSYQI